MTSPARKRAAFLDRDGVIVEPVLDLDSNTFESPLAAAHVSLAAGVVDGLQALRAEGFITVVVSNQPAAAKGTVALTELQAVHERTVELLAAAGVGIDLWRYCFHHPAGVVPELSGTCRCRKPAPGMIFDAAGELGIEVAASWMVGDADSDILAGESAGCLTVLVEHPRTGHRRARRSSPDHFAADLAAAAVTMALPEEARYSQEP